MSDTWIVLSIGILLVLVEGIYIMVIKHREAKYLLRMIDNPLGTRKAGREDTPAS